MDTQGKKKRRNKGRGCGGVVKREDRFDADETTRKIEGRFLRAVWRDDVHTRSNNPRKERRTKT